jgi:hypothetical protein
VALVIGSVTADVGMSKAIYHQVDALLSPPLQAAIDAAPDEAKPKAQEALQMARDGWKKLAFAIATGVIGHIVSNMEVSGIQARGDISASVSGTTGPAPPAAHAHPMSLSATQSSVTFTQSNDGTGRVR